MGKDALRKFQQKREGPPVAQRLSYEDTDDDDGDGADPPLRLRDLRAMGKESLAGLGVWDDVLKSLGGLGLGEAGAAAKVAEAEGEAEAVAPSPPSEDFEDRTEEISAAVEATAESQGTQMEPRRRVQAQAGLPTLPAPGGRDQVAVEAPQDAKRWNSRGRHGPGQDDADLGLPVRPLPRDEAAAPSWLPRRPC